MFSIALHVCSISVPARPQVSYRHVQYCSTYLLKQCAHPPLCVLQTCSVLLYMFAQTVCPPALKCLTDMFSIALHVCQTVCPPALMCLTDMLSIALHVCPNSVPTCPHVSYRHVQYCYSCLLKQCAHLPSCVLQTCPVLHYMFAQTVCPPTFMCFIDMFSIALHVWPNSVPTRPNVCYKHVLYCSSCLLKQCPHPP